MSRKDWMPVAALTLWAGALALIESRLWPFEAPIPGYWANAQEFARNGRIPDTFAPDFYASVLGTGLDRFGKAGVPASQASFYVLGVLAIYLIFRLMSLRPVGAALAGGVAALCPDLLTSVSKVWDLGIACTAVLGLASCLLLFLRQGPRGWLIVLSGAWLGFGTALRPNFPSLALPLALAIWHGAKGRQQRVFKSLGALAAVVLVASATLYGLASRAHGGFYMPENGPYNFFAGANQFTGEALLRWENAEPSIAPALRSELGSRASADPHDPRLGKELTALAAEYIWDHPLRWGIGYSTLKLLTLFRPDTKIHALRSAVGCVRLFVSLGVFVWAGAFATSLRARRIDARDWILLAASVAYVLPFLMTNSDPRLGFPLLLLLWVHAAALMVRRRVSPGGLGPVRTGPFPTKEPACQVLASGLG